MRESRGLIGLLAVLQALLLTSNVANVEIASLIGAALAPDIAWATLPLTSYVVGTALTAAPASLLMRHRGRRFGFRLGAMIGFTGAGVCAFALAAHSFAVFLGGTALLGSYSAFGQYYRFAAAETVGPDWRSRAISLVLLGGIIGAVLGPESAAHTRDLFALPYLGPYVVLMGCAALAFALLGFLRLPAARDIGETLETARPLRVIVRQPRFAAAVLGALAGYAVMNFLMVATPLAMSGHQHGAAVAFVIAWHVVAMYAPSFVSGDLIRRFGAIPVMLCGVLLMTGTAFTAATGLSVLHFWGALVLLGLGWNCLYIGGTTLLTTCHHLSERGKVQGLNDTLVFTTTGVTSLLSGQLLHYIGWQSMVLLTLPLLAITFATLLWAWGRPEPEPVPAQGHA